ncbi:MAG: hypothetical protein ACYCOR_06745 [Acidobacteriaceae bacterium]
MKLPIAILLRRIPDPREKLRQAKKTMNEIVHENQRSEIDSDYVSPFVEGIAIALNALSSFTPARISETRCDGPTSRITWSRISWDSGSTSANNHPKGLDVDTE